VYNITDLLYNKFIGIWFGSHEATSSKVPRLNRKESTTFITLGSKIHNNGGFMSIIHSPILGKLNYISNLKQVHSVLFFFFKKKNMSNEVSAICIYKFQQYEGNDEANQKCQNVNDHLRSNRNIFHKVMRSKDQSS